jgi:hypothetical protein
MESIELYHADILAPSGQMKSLRAAMRDGSFATLLLPIRPAANIQEDSQTEW